MKSSKKYYNALDLTRVVLCIGILLYHLNILKGGYLESLTNLYEEFPNGYFDVKISRTAYVAHGMLTHLKNNGLLGNSVVFNLGANGDCSLECKKEIIEVCEDRDIFWLIVTNDKDVNINSELEELSNMYDNVHIIDWNKISNGHKEYFFSDGIHLTEEGNEALSKLLKESINKK